MSAHRYTDCRIESPRILDVESERTILEDRWADR